MSAMLGLISGTAWATQITVESSACRAVAHQPTPDVNYQPGIAANGSAVAPADLPSHGPQISMQNLPPAVLTVDLARRLHLPANWQAEMEQPVAILSNENNQWLLNGQPIQPERSVVAELCGHK